MNHSLHPMSMDSIHSSATIPSESVPATYLNAPRQGSPSLYGVVPLRGYLKKELSCIDGSETVPHLSTQLLF